MPERLPNELFSSWFVRSGWSKGEVARLVNRRARDLGATHVATDTSRVRRWLDGEQPRDPIPRILTELFSERFGCVVTLGDLGLREPASPIAGTLTDLPWSGDRTAELLAEFCRSDLILGRRGAGGAPPLAAGSALVEPVKRWLLPAPGAAPAFAPAPIPAPARSQAFDGAPAGTAGANHAAVGIAGGAAVLAAAGATAAIRPRTGRIPVLVEQLEEAVRTFRDWDAAAGGGVRRAAVVGQLYEVAEVVRQLPEAAHGRVLRIAAQFAQLAGEMAFDSALQATAQRYLILALHAAKEAGDRGLAMAILASMGRQLIHLNRAQDAVDLLAVGRTAARGELEPLVCSVADAVEARAYGALGRAEPCHACAEHAKAAHAKATAEDRGPEWLSSFNAAALHTELGHAYRDLAARAPESAAQALAEYTAAAELYEQRWPGQLRGRVTALAGAAQTHVLLGDAPAAAAALRTAGTLAVRLRSRHTDELLRDTAARARQRFPQDPAFREVADRPREPAAVPAPTRGSAPAPVPADRLV